MGRYGGDEAGASCAACLGVGVGWLGLGGVCRVRARVWGEDMVCRVTVVAPGAARAGQAAARSATLVRIRVGLELGSASATVRFRLTLARVVTLALTLQPYGASALASA